MGLKQTLFERYRYSINNSVLWLLVHLRGKTIMYSYHMTMKHSTPIVTEDDVKNQLTWLNLCKSTGPNNLYPRVLKELSRELSTPLTFNFNRSPHTGDIPKN